MPFHVWIKLNEYWFLDLTTYQFQMKMEQLNQDGQNVPVTWDPKFLLFTRSDISSYRDVQQSFSSKLIYYKERPDMRQMMESEVGVMEADKDDVDALEAIYRQLASGSLDLVIGPHGTVEYL